MLETIQPRWTGLCVVAAPGPSLTKEVAAACKGQRVLAVGDAWRRLPWAEVLYHCDSAWWNVHKGLLDFAGEKWSSHEPGTNDKLDVAQKYGLRLVRGKSGEGFSLDPTVVHYGRNSGFQAINLAILFGANPIVLVGLDMKGTTHFFGHHPKGLRNGVEFSGFVSDFDKAAKLLPQSIRILNATPGSAIKCFRQVRLEDVLERMSAAS